MNNKSTLIPPQVETNTQPSSAVQLSQAEVMNLCKLQLLEKEIHNLGEKLADIKAQASSEMSALASRIDKTPSLVDESHRRLEAASAASSAAIKDLIRSVKDDLKESMSESSKRMEDASARSTAETKELISSVKSDLKESIKESRSDQKEFAKGLADLRVYVAKWVGGAAALAALATIVANFIFRYLMK